MHIYAGLFVISLYLVPSHLVTLLHLLSSYSIYFLTAENKDLAVTAYNLFMLRK